MSSRARHIDSVRTSSGSRKILWLPDTCIHVAVCPAPVRGTRLRSAPCAWRRLARGDIALARKVPDLGMVKTGRGYIALLRTLGVPCSLRGHDSCTQGNNHHHESHLPILVLRNAEDILIQIEPRRSCAG